MIGSFVMVRSSHVHKCRFVGVPKPNHENQWAVGGPPPVAASGQTSMVSKTCLRVMPGLSLARRVRRSSSLAGSIKVLRIGGPDRSASVFPHPPETAARSVPRMIETALTLRIGLIEYPNVGGDRAPPEDCRVHHAGWARRFGRPPGSMSLVLVWNGSPWSIHGVSCERGSRRIFENV